MLEDHRKDVSTAEIERSRCADKSITVGVDVLMPVQCDQKRPSCSQCIRSGKQCYGYRDALTTMFKDETAVVARKAKKRYEALAFHAQQGVEPIGSQTSDASSYHDYWADSESYSLRGSPRTVTRYLTPESMTRRLPRLSKIKPSHSSSLTTSRSQHVYREDSTSGCLKP